MAYLFFLVISIALLAGFLALSIFETQRGTRIFAVERTRFDERVAHLSFIASHVDWSAFLREETSRIAGRLAHDIAHLSLQVVRAVERFLTNLVRRLRISTHAIDAAPRENAREFVKTLSDFKGHLETKHPDVPDVLE